MFMTDRIRKLQEHYSVLFEEPRQGALHEILNTLDDRAGLHTGYEQGHDGCCHSPTGLCNCRRPVGARVALHEKYLEGLARIPFKPEKDVPMKTGYGPDCFYHWLGNNGD